MILTGLSLGRVLGPQGQLPVRQLTEQFPMSQIPGETDCYLDQPQAL